jgi:hypothetical protein
MRDVMRRTVRTGFVLAILLNLALLAWLTEDVPVSEEEIQEGIDDVVDRVLPYAEETRRASYAATTQAESAAERLVSRLTFECAPPDNSYVHTRLDTDEAYDESWRYTIYINAGTDTFNLSHEASSLRTLPEECYEIWDWEAQQSGQTDQDHRIVTMIELIERRSNGCEELPPLPAWDETREDVFEWWLISSPPFFDRRFQFNTCTCNANAHQLTQEDIEEFQRTGVCPPCVPGAMLCTEEQRIQ